MSLPAARQGDLVLCPKHGLGPTDRPGAREVLINGRRASALADLVACASSGAASGVIAEGAATVLAGGVPLAAQSMRTDEGGAIVGPCSPNVLIGGAMFSLPPGIVVDGPAPFRNKALRDLYFLSRTGTGRALFAELARTGRKVTIKPHANGESAQSTGSLTVPDGEIGMPSDSTVYYDPRPSFCIYTQDGGFAPEQAQVALFHELVHANQIADGTEPAVDQSAEWQPFYKAQNEAESRAVGDGEPGRLAENDLRYELGLPQREGIFMNPVAPDPEYAEPTDFRPGQDP
jgi:uncharacterized Zn-binding protein involved in type VI secretion